MWLLWRWPKDLLTWTLLPQLILIVLWNCKNIISVFFLCVKIGPRLFGAFFSFQCLPKGTLEGLLFFGLAPGPLPWERGDRIAFVGVVTNKNYFVDVELCGGIFVSPLPTGKRDFFTSPPTPLPRERGEIKYFSHH